MVHHIAGFGASQNLHHVKAHVPVKKAVLLQIPQGRFNHALLPAAVHRLGRGAVGVGGAQLDLGKDEGLPNLADQVDLSGLSAVIARPEDMALFFKIAGRHGLAAVALLLIVFFHAVFPALPYTKFLTKDRLCMGVIPYFLMAAMCSAVP